jgi:hypothetical protein
MKPMAMRVVSMIFAFTVVAQPLGALAQDDPACAKFQDPLAYNACLASHGPKATNLGASRGPVQSSGHAAPIQSARPAASRPVRGSPYATRRHGRVHMEFRLR